MVLESQWDLPPCSDIEDSEQISNQLLALSVENEFTRSLVSNARQIFFETLQAYGIFFTSETELVRTYFIPDTRREEVEKIIGSPQGNKYGEHLSCPKLNIVYLLEDFESTDLIAVIQAYFHELVHGFGVSLRGNKNSTYTEIVGFYHEITKLVVDRREGQLRGDYLEEVIVDYIAVKMAKKYLSLLGHDLSEEDITHIAGGDSYLFFRRVLLEIIGDNTKLETLFVSARFDHFLFAALRDELAVVYGKGSLRKLFMLPVSSAAIGNVLFEFLMKKKAMRV